MAILKSGGGIGGVIKTVVDIGGSIGGGTSVVLPGPIQDGIDLIRPIISGKSTVTDGAIRLAVITLEIDRAIKGDAEGLKLVHDLSARILLQKPPEVQA